MTALKSRIAIAMVFFASQLVSAATLPGPLVDVNWLKDNLDKVTVLDVRKDTKSFAAKPVYVKDKKKKGEKKLARVGGHIPGAVLVNYKKVRAMRKIDGNEVTRMLPDRKSFESLMQGVGLDKNSTVVVASKGEGNGDMTMATRLYWQLKYYGHDNMAILDGGTGGWIKAGNPVESKAAKVKKGNWVATAERKEIMADSNDVAQAVRDGSSQLVDTRAISLYYGTWHKKSYVHDKGHIEGARPFPNELLTAPKLPAKFNSVPTLKALSKEMGINPDGKMITYCNSGHLASGSWFVYSELMGNKDVKLYDGSMHQWTLEKRPTKKLSM